MMKYVIVDDESVAHDIIEDYCNMVPNLELVGHCYDALDALNLLSKTPVDLVFLDLNMPKLKGFEFLRILDKPPKVIVTTAYKEFALEGYELNVVDYLLKPFDFNRFLKAVNKAMSTTEVSEESNLSQQPKDRSIFVKHDGVHSQVKVKEILYLEAAGNYTKIIRGNETLLVRGKLTEMHEMLADDDFIQVHKSFVVAKSHIHRIEGNRIFMSGYEVPIGKRFKGNVLGFL